MAEEGKREHKAIVVDRREDERQQRSAVPTSRRRVTVILAHHWTDDDGTNHSPGEAVTLPSEYGRSLAAQGYGQIAD